MWLLVIAVHPGASFTATKGLTEMNMTCVWPVLLCGHSPLPPPCAEAAGKPVSRVEQLAHGLCCMGGWRWVTCAVCWGEWAPKKQRPRRTSSATWSSRTSAATPPHLLYCSWVAEPVGGLPPHTASATYEQQRRQEELAVLHWPCYLQAAEVWGVIIPDMGDCSVTLGQSYTLNLTYLCWN